MLKAVGLMKPIERISIVDQVINNLKEYIVEGNIDVGDKMPTEKESVEIVETSIKGLDLIGKKITHERRGEGVVVGYSSVSGSPFAFFYDKGRVVCVDECEITSIQ